MSKPGLLRRFFGGFWSLLTRLRLALSNLLFIVVLVLLYFVYVGGSPMPLPNRAALLLNPAGVVVDEKSLADPLLSIIGQPDPANHEVLLRDMVAAIDIAREDPAINSLVMELGSLVYAGLSKTQEMARAINEFKASGKRVVAVADYYSQDQYLLASYADTIITHPFGGLALEGYSSYHNYFREALEKLSINIHVFKAGEHKSVAEPFLRNDMSEGEREITSRWLGMLWAQYTDTVEKHRELPAGTLDRYLADFAERMAAGQGDLARVALDAGLVDELLTRDEANSYLVELVGAEDEEGLYEAVDFEFYLAHKRHTQPPASGQVAVIIAEGDIVPGEQPPGAIGGDTLSRLIADTVADGEVDAIVLRVNSGGGSVFASEVIRQQVLAAKEAGLPVVVSMGTVAASGGYYIAANADQIWATPGTITGSIGVFAALPTLEQALPRLGVHTDGVGTTPLAGSSRLDRPLNPQLSAALTSMVEFNYREFLQLVAEGRGMSVEAVDAVGQGRVWSAEDAKAHGLIDRLGGLEEAIQAAADLANLPDYRVDYREQHLSPRELLMRKLSERFGLGEVLPQGAARRLLQPLQRAAQELSLLQDPRNIYVRCLSCGAWL